MLEDLPKPGHPRNKHAIAHSAGGKSVLCVGISPGRLRFTVQYRLLLFPWRYWFGCLDRQNRDCVIPRPQGHRKAGGEPEDHGARYDARQAHNHHGFSSDCVRRTPPNISGQESAKRERARDVAGVVACRATGTQPTRNSRSSV